MMTSRLTLLTILLFTFNVNAQDLDTVTIAGRIMDQNGAVIPGAEIQVKLIKTGLTRTTTSDAEGRYRLIQLEPGTYTIRVSIPGFALQETADVATVSGQNLQHDALLIPSDVVVAPVVVTDSDAPVIDTKRTVVGATLTARDTELLPINPRSVLDLVFTLPGVTEEPFSTRDLAEDRNTNHANTPEEAGTFSL